MRMPISFVRLATPRDINSLAGSRERRLAPRRDEIFVEERDRVVARVALSADEASACGDRQPIKREQLPDTRIVRHLGKRARVRTAAAAAAGATVVRGFMRIVQADRSMTDNEHKRSKSIDDADVFDHAAHDIGHLADREARIRADRRHRVVAIELQAGARRHHRCLADASPPPRQGREEDAQHERH